MTTCVPFGKVFKGAIADDYAKTIIASTKYPTSSLSNLLLVDEFDVKSVSDAGQLKLQMERALLPITMAALKAVEDSNPPTELDRAQAMGPAVRRAMTDPNANKFFLFTGTTPNTKHYQQKLTEFKTDVLVDSLAGFMDDFSTDDKKAALARAGKLFDVLTKTVETCSTDSQGNYQSSCVVKTEDGGFVGYFVAQVMKVTSSLKEVTQGKETTKEVDTTMDAHTDTFKFLGAEAVEAAIAAMTPGDLNAASEMLRVLQNNGRTL